MDLLRFFPQFGTEPFEALDGPLLFRIAARLASYDGALTHAFRLLLDRHDPRSHAPPATATAPDRGSAAPVRAPSRAVETAGELHHGIRIPKGAEVVTFAEMALANPDLIGFQKVG